MLWGRRQGRPLVLTRLAAEKDLRNALVIGTFRDRTRSSVARQEAMLILELLGVHHAAQEVLGTAPTTKVIRVRMRTADVVAAAIARCRAMPILSVMMVATVWINRARTPAEAAKAAPISRAARELNVHMEAQRQARRYPGWTCEGEYAPGCPGTASGQERCSCSAPKVVRWHPRPDRFAKGPSRLARRFALTPEPRQSAASRPTNEAPLAPLRPRLPRRESPSLGQAGGVPAGGQ